MSAKMRGTGGNVFVPPDISIDALCDLVRERLRHLEGYASRTGRSLDLGQITVDTRTIPSGDISINVTADLVDQ